MWIDSFLDTFKKRIVVLSILILFYWLWQNIWQSVFLFDLMRVSSYEELFQFYANLDAYNNSVLVRIILSMISRNSISVASFFLSFLENVGFFDICILLITLTLYANSEQKRKWLFFPILYFSMFIYIGICVGVGMNADSIDSLLNILRMLSIGSIIMEGILFVWVLYRLVEKFLWFIEH